MASLQTLRDKGGIIVAVVIGISLVAFVLGDLLSSGGALFSDNTDVAEINGKTVSIQEYQNEVAILGEIYKLRGGVAQFGAQMNDMIIQEAWQNFVLRYGVRPELDAIGVSVGVDEQTELLVGVQPSPIITEFFGDPQNVRAFVANLSQDQTGQMTLLWNDIQENVVEQSQIIKFKALIDRGAYVTSQQADFYAQLGSTTYDVRYIAQDVATVADELVKVTDAQINEYYKANSARFRQEEARTINYVAFDIQPSQEDYDMAKEHILALALEFETSDNPKQFATFNSEEQYDNRYYKKEELNSSLADFAFGDNIGKVYAPEMANDEYLLYRFVDKKEMPDSISFSYIAMEPSDKSVADSLTLALKQRGANFAQAARTFSLDQSTAPNGGSVGTINPQDMPVELSEPILEMKVNEIKQINLPSGSYIVKLEKRKDINPKVQLAKIVYTIDPSDKTRVNVRQEAVDFATASQSAGFDSMAKANMMMIRTEVLYPHSSSMQAYKDSKEVVRWAYEKNIGEQSDILEYGDTYILATLKDIAPEGTKPLAEVQGVITTMLTNQAKIALAAEKLKGGSVEQLAQTLDAEIIEQSGVNFLSNSYSVAMYDPAFAGAVAALSANQSSKPITGNQAAYLVEVVSTTTTPQSPLMVKEGIIADQNQSLFQGAYQTMLKEMKVTDKRYRF